MKYCFVKLRAPENSPHLMLLTQWDEIFERIGDEYVLILQRNKTSQSFSPVYDSDRSNWWTLDDIIVKNIPFGVGYVVPVVKYYDSIEDIWFELI